MADSKQTTTQAMDVGVTANVHPGPTNPPGTSSGSGEATSPPKLDPHVKHARLVHRLRHLKRHPRPDTKAGMDNTDFVLASDLDKAIAED